MAETRKSVSILIIDDSVSDRKIYRRFLEDAFREKQIVHILEAKTGEEGLDVCRSINPDCIILDFRLPDVDGLQLMSSIRQFCRAPVIFITGQPLPLTQTRAYIEGVIKYLSKDFLSAESLKSAVDEALTVSKTVSKNVRPNY